MIYRLILPDYAASAGLPKVVEGEFSMEEVLAYNAQGYSAFFLPNYPSEPTPGKPVDGSMIDRFEWVYVDMDRKDGAYASDDDFFAAIASFPIRPSRIVSSGHGIHVYWGVLDLDAMGFLRLQRRLMRFFNTDEAVAKIYQLMRVPGTKNTKYQGEDLLCETLFEEPNTYTSEQLDAALPPITHADEAYCQQHYAKTYRTEDPTQVDEKIPLSFAKLLRSNSEVRDIWAGGLNDRSKGDFRLGHIMFASGLTKEEALSVLVNSPKALARAPAHRVSYAENIVDKIWTFELSPDKTGLDLSSSVRDILSRSGDTLKGTRFPCWKYLDNTAHGFRLGQVIGLVAGSGVGKTAMALNMFEGFVQSNPDYEHFFIPLEQPANEIADRWRTMCGDKVHLHDKVHVISNYAEDGSFRHLSFDEIKDYLLKFQATTKKKIGCVVIDHIGALKKKGKDGENQALMDICHAMKAFAVQLNVLLVMQSQAPREKAGIGDLELSKDAAYGTVYFESYCDYLISIWQPLKRCYVDGAPTVTAYKFCKIRHKKTGVDVIHEDVPYLLKFDSTSEHMTELNEDEEHSLTFWVTQATNKRKQDRKTDVVTYISARVGDTDGKVAHSEDQSTASRLVQLPEDPNLH